MTFVVGWASCRCSAVLTGGHKRGFGRQQGGDVVQQRLSADRYCDLSRHVLLLHPLPASSRIQKLRTTLGGDVAKLHGDGPRSNAFQQRFKRGASVALHVRRIPLQQGLEVGKEAGRGGRVAGKLEPTSSLPSGIHDICIAADAP